MWGRIVTDPVQLGAIPIGEFGWKNESPYDYAQFALSEERRHETWLGLRTHELAVRWQCGGGRAADFFTLVTSAVRNALDVWAYVKDVLDQLLAGSTDDDSLRLDVWKESHPEAIREYRAAERRGRADRKQRRRANLRRSAR